MLFLIAVLFSNLIISNAVAAATNDETTTLSLNNPTTHIAEKGSETDRLSLLAIKSEISLDPYGVLNSWNESLHFCKWQGVTCGRKHKRVTRLELFSSRLVGKLSPSIGNLSFLRIIHLYDNGLHGNIPTHLGRLLRLQDLNLGNNSFSGQIPTNLSRCSKLTSLTMYNNHLVGSIPMEFGSLSQLMFLGLALNKLTGSIQAVGNMTSLQTLFLSENSLQGTIPYSIGLLKDLQVLALQVNKFSGETPPSIFNHSSMSDIVLAENRLQGHLPTNLGLLLPNLKVLDISFNLFTGPVPVTLSNLSELTDLSISCNTFTGKFQFDGRNKPYLYDLTVAFAFSKVAEATNINFLDTLTNCSLLRRIQIAGNNFEGVLPQSVSNLSKTLEEFNLEKNHIYGNLPSGFGSRFVNLLILDLKSNSFSGPLPIEIGKLTKLEQLDLSYNEFSGKIPSTWGNLSKLSDLELNNNNLQGYIPSSLGNCQSLLIVLLYENKLTGVVPPELFHASNIYWLDASRNHLGGMLSSEIKKLRNLQELGIAYNNFSGQISTAITECKDLEILEMQGNTFSGSIPPSFSSLKSIQHLDLSNNHLSGRIPISFSNLSFLTYFNLSFNKLEGEVPTDGAFKNASIILLAGNTGLCGGISELHLPRCPSKKGEDKRKLSHALMVLIISIGIVTCVLVLALFLYYIISKKKDKKDVSSGSHDTNSFLKVSYQMLLEATGRFSPSNLIGCGGFGSVYKGILHQHDIPMVVAIKVINLEYHGAIKSFMAECKTLKNIRHRNLCKLISVCSSIDSQGNDFKALIYPFTPKGSLDKWLYINQSTNEQQNNMEHLNLSQRLSIVIDVASALNYLHNDVVVQIIHCDLKPSNILLDDDLVAHVGDFGLAKFLQELPQERHSSSIGVRGTIGYAPPEYGLGSEVSKEGDLYSFGIVVLEMMTLKKPTDPMFYDGFNLHSFAKGAVSNHVVEIVDPIILVNSEVRRQRTNNKIEWIKSIIQIGIECSMELPKDRMSIKDVVNNLNKIRNDMLGKRR